MMGQPGIRTHNLSLTRRMLYQLCYWGWLAWGGRHLLNSRLNTPTTNGGPHPQTYQNCHLTRIEWNTALSDIQTREKKVSQMERNLKTKEKELDRPIAQKETQKTVISGLEASVKELMATNKLLQRIIDAEGSHNPYQRRTQHSNSIEDEKPGTQDEIRTLREELRHKELECKLMEKVSEMEHRLWAQLPASQLSQPYTFHSQPYTFHPPPHLIPQPPQWAYGGIPSVPMGGHHLNHPVAMHHPPPQTGWYHQSHVIGRTHHTRSNRHSATFHEDHSQRPPSQPNITTRNNKGRQSDP